MFEDASLMVSTKSNNMFRVTTDRETQLDLCSHFSSRANQFLQDKQEVAFDGRYKPEEDDILFIDNFKIDNAILDAIRTPLSIPSLNKNIVDIKYLFMGEKNDSDSTEEFTIVFQKVKSDQCIVPTKLSIFLSNDSFVQEKRAGIIIGDSIDCYFTNNKLFFTSYFFARQIFKLNEYYRIATDKDIDKYLQTVCLDFECKEEFHSLSNTYIRQKVAQIQDSGILSKHSAQEIQSFAEPLSIPLELKNDKLFIPNDKEKIKVILGFLDEEAYLGPFSQVTYLANSKRKISN